MKQGTDQHRSLSLVRARRAAGGLRTAAVLRSARLSLTAALRIALAACLVITTELLGQVLSHVQVLLGRGVSLADQLLELWRTHVPHRFQFSDHVAVLDDLHANKGHIELFALLGFFEHLASHLQGFLSGLLSHLGQLLRNLLALALLSETCLTWAVLSGPTPAGIALTRTALAGLALPGLSQLSLTGQRLSGAVLSGLSRLTALPRLRLSRSGWISLSRLAGASAALTAGLQLFQFLIHLLVVLDQLLSELFDFLILSLLGCHLAQFDFSLVAQHHLLDEELFDALVALLALRALGLPAQLGLAALALATLTVLVPLSLIALLGTLALLSPVALLALTALLVLVSLLSLVLRLRRALRLLSLYADGQQTQDARSDDET